MLLHQVKQLLWCLWSQLMKKYIFEGVRLFFYSCQEKSIYCVFGTLKVAKCVPEVQKTILKQTKTSIKTVTTTQAPSETTLFAISSALKLIVVNIIKPTSKKISLLRKQLALENFAWLLPHQYILGCTQTSEQISAWTMPIQAYLDLHILFSDVLSLIYVQIFLN